MNLINYSLIFFFTLASHSSSMEDQKFQACAPTTCGQGPKITYPFYLSQVQKPFCGYPNFDIICNDDDYPVLKISNDDYIIKDIYYNNQSFLVASASVYEEEGEDSCPMPLHNVTLYRTPFNISPDYIDFSFLYNCTLKPTKFLSYPITGATNASFYSFAGFHIQELELYYNYSLESCRYLVNSPLHATGDFDNSIFQKNYTEILKMGFMLNWTAHNCSSCEISGGRCGFENNEFVCFCRDRPYQNSCYGGNFNFSAYNVHYWFYISHI
ncbi:LEAF RUST 10 DISEASE-RESISTANCE LOCUS RECEPTOR-LIKE PROTEIN KINASE-like 1.2 [Jatropha curcas]|uniref:LEAF RUST 10 DISEASE-RESISTANCE LOCUS RECEPTOR-LIKE PROTEIN KINASE-like 1.2 n=1 Tax=Jatropha curcas TaxID=180498 RepID=UPI0018962BE7|nr:LEAF RUST 10 DISEASE-RESISTANCE LOCUS RECEPTOR-LIKE PROTEIN KINASE-like 1.2 [Jatropha curcas]